MTGRNIWLEKYRPETLDDVKGQQKILDRIQAYIDDGEIPNLLFSGPAGVGKTTTAISIAKDLFGDSWKENYLELNASDKRGIDVVREEVKEFAKVGMLDHKRIIFLDEADSLTDQAQSALRRVMEKHHNTVRFILSCNYKSKIINPLQSRCTVFDFSPLSDRAIVLNVLEIAKNENIDITDEAVETIVYISSGDMRVAVNTLQALSTIDGEITKDDVYDIVNAPKKEEIEEILQCVVNGEFLKTKRLTNDILDAGVPVTDIIDKARENIWNYDLTEMEAVLCLERLGETEYRIAMGATPKTQLMSSFAFIALLTSGEYKNNPLFEDKL